ncbi:MAG: hypothetical protein KDA84_14395, partial [Planctomycetaceae bacterium]|nr:hypothetical protein [Planctomycetaceae bacterium]
MTFNDHIDVFAGKSVFNFDENSGIKDPENTAYRISIDDYDDQDPLEERLVRLLADPASDQLTALVIGVWGPWEELYEYSSGPFLEALVTAAPQLPHLTALFLGDIIYEENEVSWIIQTDV